MLRGQRGESPLPVTQGHRVLWALWLTPVPQQGGPGVWWWSQWSCWLPSRDIVATHPSVTHPGEDQTFFFFEQNLNTDPEIRPQRAAPALLNVKGKMQTPRTTQHRSCKKAALTCVFCGICSSVSRERNPRNGFKCDKGTSKRECFTSTFYF